MHLSEKGKLFCIVAWRHRLSGGTEQDLLFAKITVQQSGEKDDIAGDFPEIPMVPLCYIFGFLPIGSQVANLGCDVSAGGVLSDPGSLLFQEEVGVFLAILLRVGLKMCIRDSSNTHVSLPTVDIGLPQLSMHSPYETAGRLDVEYMVRAMSAFYSSVISCDRNNFFEIC